MARTPSPDASDNAALKDHIRDSANHIWLAGLGAFAKAQQEGGKVFESLIKDGLHMQQQTQQVAEEKIAQATHTMSTLASQFTERAGGSWDRLETLYSSTICPSDCLFKISTDKKPTSYNPQRLLAVPSWIK